MAVTVSHGRAERHPAEIGGSFWPWFIQRVTAVVLVVLLAVHIAVNHFGNISKVHAAAANGQARDLIMFNDVAYRLANFLWWAVDVLLLAFVLFHGLNGIRNIAIDLGVRGSRMRVVSGFLTLVGIVAFVFGIFALVAFRRYS